MRAFLEERLQLSLLFQIRLGGKCNSLLLLSTQEFQNKGISCASPGALSICMEKLVFFGGKSCSLMKYALFVEKLYCSIWRLTQMESASVSSVGTFQWKFVIR